MQSKPGIFIKWSGGHSKHKSKLLYRAGATHQFLVDCGRKGQPTQEGWGEIEDRDNSTRVRTGEPARGDDRKANQGDDKRVNPGKRKCSQAGERRSQSACGNKVESDWDDKGGGGQLEGGMQES